MLKLSDETNPDEDFAIEGYPSEETMMRDQPIYTEKEEENPVVWVVETGKWTPRMGKHGEWF